MKRGINTAEGAIHNFDRTALPKRGFAQISLLSLAFLLPFLDWIEAVGMAILLLAFCAWILPSFELAPNSQNASVVKERKSLLLYALSVLMLITIFPHHFAIVGAAWGISGLGDATASFVAHKAEGPRLPWNPVKTWAGFGAFWAAGAFASVIMLRWIAPGFALEGTLVLSLVAALIGAAVESLPVPIDDNLSVPLVTAAFLFCASLVRRSAFDSNLPFLKTRVWLALGVTLVLALMAFAFKTVTRSGAIAGFVLGAAVYLGYGYKSFVVLLTFFILGSIATRLGYQKKKERGAAEGHGGRRTWREAMANGLAGACCALLVISTHWEKVFLVALVASFAEAAGDTVASEIGQWLSPSAYLITNLQRVAAGENGAVSSAGTLAGLMASAMVVGVGVALGLVAGKGAAIALIAAFAGNLLDSLLGATAERKGLLTNGLVNFASTVFAAGLALALAFRFRI